MYRFWLMALWGLFPGLVLTAEPATPVATPAMPPPPTEITADSLDYDMNGRQAVFRGHVKVVSDDVDLRASQMTVTFGDEDQVRQVSARGEVLATHDKLQVRCGQAEYDAPGQVLVCEDRPVLEQEGNRITEAVQLVYHAQEGICQTKGGRPVLRLHRRNAGGADLDMFTREKPTGNDQPAAGPEPAKPLAPTEIIADQQIFDRKKGLITFLGNVQVIDQQVNLRADKMVVYLDDKGEISRILAEGGVEIVREDNRATGGKAEYEVSKGLVVLSETPVLVQGRSRITGAERIIYHKNDGLFATEGGRVRTELLDVSGKGKGLPLDLLDRAGKPAGEQGPTPPPTEPTPAPPAPAPGAVPPKPTVPAAPGAAPAAPGNVPNRAGT